MVLEIFRAGKEAYGSRRIRKELKKQKRSVSRRRVVKIMRKLRIAVKRKRRFKVTTDSKHHFPVHPNLLERHFDVSAQDCVWASDITYIPTDEGWLYLGVVVDMFSRRVVGWSMSRKGDC